MFITNLFMYILLGLIQGFTEPIPISSSGHLVIFQNLFDFKVLQDLNFGIMVNFGSFIAIVIVFWKDLKVIFTNTFKYIKTKEKKYYNHFKYFLLVTVGTIPAGIVGILFKDFIEQYSGNVKLIGIALLITALFLFLIRNLKGSKDDEKITFKDAIIIGLFQVIALFPGISRSGSTLVGGMFSDLKRESAFKFSFMLYIPISLATFILGTTDLIQSNLDLETWICYIAGMLASGILTFFSVKWFRNIMNKGKLIYFVYYCLIVGILVLLFL